MRFHSAHRPLTACGKTHAAFDRRSIPAEPRRFAPLIVAFQSKYTRAALLLPHAPCCLAGLGAHVGFTTGC